MDLFFGHVAPADLYIRKEASTSLPYFTVKEDYKKQSAYKTLSECEPFLKLATGGKAQLKSLLQQYDAVFIAAIHERQQPNAISYEDGVLKSKSRTAATESEARSGDYSGRTIASMEVRDKHGNIISGHFAMRRRDVFGENGPINYFLTGIIGCFRAVYLNLFSFTYKMRSREEKLQKSIRYKHVIGCDVKTMDKMIPRWFADFVFARLPKYLDDRVVEVMRRLFHAPYVCPPPGPGTSSQYNPVFGGSPLDPGNFKQHPGLPSGIAFNPDWGKLWMTFVYLVLLRDCGALSNVAEIEPLLRGLNLEHALFDMSDDATLLTNSDTVAKKLQQPSSPYAILEFENPVIYLGDVFCQTSAGRLVVANPVTYLVNMLCREDSVDRKSPAQWAVSYQARTQVYSGTPIYRDLNQIFEEVMKKRVGFNPTLLARSIKQVRQEYNMIDALVRDNPRVLHFKIDPEDVSPEVLDDVVAKVPASAFYNHIKHLFKVPTVDYEEVA